MCVCFSLSLHVLSLLRCCSHRLHIETTNMLKRRKKLKKCRFEWVERGDTWYAEQPCNSAGLWREAGWGDLQNAPGDSALQRFGTLCCEVLTCFDLRRFNAFYWVICVVLYVSHVSHVPCRIHMASCIHWSQLLSLRVGSGPGVCCKNFFLRVLTHK